MKQYIFYFNNLEDGTTRSRIIEAWDMWWALEKFKKLMSHIDYDIIDYCEYKEMPEDEEIDDNYTLDDLGHNWY